VNHRPISILCVDDHEVVIEGIRSVVNRQPDMEVVAVAANGPEAIRQYFEHRPAITLMDLRLPGMSGMDAIREIRRRDPGARVIALTIYLGDEDVYRALQSGAATYVLKDTLSADLVHTIRAVYSGEKPAPHRIAAALAEHAGHPELTPREHQVLEQMATGRRNKEIAVALHISEETVRVHIKAIFTKLDVSDRTAAVIVALRRGLLHIP
jgi:DNA-binding NarL/FixJ family response regulator